MKSAGKRASGDKCGKRVTGEKRGKNGFGFAPDWLSAQQLYFDWLEHVP